MFGKKRNLLLFVLEESKRESLQLEHENVIGLAPLRDGVEEGRRFSKEERYPMTSKELNAEPYEVKISCTVL
jgi:hypothetical protein